jgi:hypothetical protein
MYDTRTALARITADVGAREAQVRAKEIDEQRSRFNLGRDGAAVYGKRDGRHSFASLKTG